MSNSKTSAELVLGTARLGEPDNNNAEMATLVLQSAIRAGLRWIETSASYTASEERIGRAFRLGNHPGQQIEHAPQYKPFRRCRAEQRSRNA